MAYEGKIDVYKRQVAAITTEFKGIHTMCGLSNISFGLSLIHILIMLDRIDELIEIAKKYVKMGYDPIEAIKIAEKKIYEKYLNS